MESEFREFTETGTACIDIKTSELNFLLNYERFDFNFTFFMQRVIQT